MYLYGQFQKQVMLLKHLIFLFLILILLAQTMPIFQEHNWLSTTLNIIQNYLLTQMKKPNFIVH